MELFFCSRIETGNFFLDEEESHHLFKVMRHSVGDELMVTDGKGKLIRAKIAQEQKKSCVLEIIEVVKQEPQLSPAIHVAIAPTKNIDRFEWFLEKATEIGVTEITPIICQRSEREKIRHERLEKILIGAMKQSLRLWVPQLNLPIALNSFLTHDSRLTTHGSRLTAHDSRLTAHDSRLTAHDSRLTTHDFICHCQSKNLPSLQSLCKRSENVLILIGPEGDFTVDEITLAEEKGFVSVSLSETRLRTETAGMVAVHTVKLLNC